MLFLEEVKASGGHASTFRWIPSYGLKVHYVGPGSGSVISIETRSEGDVDSFGSKELEVRRGLSGDRLKVT